MYDTDASNETWEDQQENVVNNQDMLVESYAKHHDNVSIDDDEPKDVTLANDEPADSNVNADQSQKQQSPRMIQLGQLILH
ncbi:hypothetical protein ACA910_001157 [Epithemia clementina (nom. ined.)]